jgi:MFS family permease
MMIHEIVGKKHLQSGVRLIATSLTLGILLGPAIGGALMLWLGPALGIMVNALIYLPLILWLWKAPYGPAFKSDRSVRQLRPMRGIFDIIDTIKSVANHQTIISMTLLTGMASLFVGNAYQAQMPEFTLNLLPNDKGLFYAILLTSSGLGAISAGIVLESCNLLQARPRTVFYLVFLWCISIISFSVSSNAYISLILLFFAGFLELTYKSMAQTLVQLNAPNDIRGRVIGLFNMSSLGLKSFSGFTVGIGGAIVGIHWSLGISAALLFSFSILLLVLVMRMRGSISQNGKLS